MIREIGNTAFKIKDKTVSLSLSVCKRIKQLAVLTAKKVSEGTRKFVSFIGKYAFVLSVFSILGVVMFFVRRGWLQSRGRTILTLTFKPIRIFSRPKYVHL